MEVLGGFGGVLVFRFLGTSLLGNFSTTF